MTFRLFSTAPLLAALASACSFSFEADLPEVEVTQHGLKVAGVPGTTRVGDVSVTGSFTLSSRNTAWSKRLGSDVFVHQVTVAASGSQPDLDFITLARVTMADSAIPEGTTEIMTYDRSQAASTSVIDVSMPSPIDITTLWSADRTVIALEVTGRVPEQTWSVDLTMKLTISRIFFDIEYFPADGFPLT